MATAQILRDWKSDEFTPTLGQVTFILSSAPRDALSTRVIVNGVDYDDATDFTVSGVTLTWLNLSFSMTTADKVSIRYQ